MVYRRLLGRVATMYTDSGSLLCGLWALRIARATGPGIHPPQSLQRYTIPLLRNDVGGLHEHLGRVWEISMPLSIALLKRGSPSLSNSKRG